MSQSADYKLDQGGILNIIVYWFDYLIILCLLQLMTHSGQNLNELCNYNFPVSSLLLTMTCSTLLRAEANANGVIPACCGLMSAENFWLRLTPALHSCCSCNVHHNSRNYSQKHKYETNFSELDLSV